MTKNDPMKERRYALELAIIALDGKRREISSRNTLQFRPGAKERLENLNRAIQILTAMKDEGPLL